MRLNATSYDVYWGSTLLGNVAASQYSGSIPAGSDGVQNWHVVAKNADNSTMGPQWSFTLDTTPPTAIYGNQIPTNGSSTLDFTVTYADVTSTVNTTTFDSSDITVTGPSGFTANAAFVSTAGNVATYRITAPGGTWDGTDDGLYTISQNANQVKDAAGNARPAGAIGSFTFDGTPPTAVYGNQKPVNGGSTLDFTITYADATSGVNTATFDSGDITVTGPNGFSANAAFVSAAGDVVTYRIAAPGGTWGGADDGVYTISQNANQVKDLAGNARPAGAIDTFTFDVTAPTAVYGKQRPTSGSTTFDFTITYADATDTVDTTTFDSDDVTVTGPNGFTANAVFVSAAGDVVTYGITAPGGTWDSADDGLYNILQNASQVKDSVGNARRPGPSQPSRSTPRRRRPSTEAKHRRAGIQRSISQ